MNVAQALQRTADGAAVFGLSRVLGITKQAVGQQLLTLRARGDVHIDRWELTKRHPRAVWVWGYGVDCPKPTPKRWTRRKAPVDVRIAQLDHQITQIESAIHGMQIERKNLVARRKRAMALGR